MVEIKNKEQLIAKGETELTRKARALALSAIEYTLNIMEPTKILNSKLSLVGSVLQVEGQSFDLDAYENIYVVGAGKATGSMAKAVETLLGKRITAGSVNVPHGSVHETANITAVEASHPLPDQAGVDGTRQMLKILEHTSEKDLVICLISGGGSSLMTYPREGITLKDKQKVTSALLKSGAVIGEINAVRKHLSGVKGGWLAKKAYPATILNLILSDVIGDSLDTIASGPTVADSTTFTDARQILEKYNLWANTPASVKKIIEDGQAGAVEETPKPGDRVFERVTNVIVGNNRAACLATCRYLSAQNVKTLLLTSMLEGEAKSIGAALAAIANETLISGNPTPKPVALVAGGETTVKVTGNGIGGRNQEVALSAALKLRGDKGIAVVASVGTDGVDGPTDAAGAIVDSNTYIEAQSLGLKPEEYLAQNDSYTFFSKTGGLIFTGQTGTNLNDISLIIIL